MTDLLLTAVLTRGRDDFRTGRKVAGRDVPAGELDPAGLLDYFRPFRVSAERFGLSAVVLHDGLPAEVVAGCPGLRFCCAVGLPDWNAFERRWVAAINYLHARDDVRRVWVVDANDVLFVTDPFRWLGRHLPAGGVAVGRERVTMRGNDWFEAGVRPLSPEYRQFLIGTHGDEHGLSCGCWAADRPTAVAVIDAALTRINGLQRHLAAHPPGHPVCLDMFAFGVVWRQQFGSRLVPFAMDGDEAVGDVPSPLIHDRAGAVASDP